MTVLVGFEFECRRSSAGTAPFSQSRGHALEPVHNLSEILFIYSHILATVSLFSRPGQNCYIPLCYLSFQQVKKDPEQALNSRGSLSLETSKRTATLQHISVKAHLQLAVHAVN